MTTPGRTWLGRMRAVGWTGLTRGALVVALTGAWCYRPLSDTLNACYQARVRRCQLGELEARIKAITAYGGPPGHLGRRHGPFRMAATLHEEGLERICNTCLAPETPIQMEVRWGGGDGPLDWPLVVERTWPKVMVARGDVEALDALRAQGWFDWYPDPDAAYQQARDRIDETSYSHDHYIVE